MKICYLGTYEKDYPRNETFIKGLSKAGVEVEICHGGVSDSFKNRYKNPLQLMLYALAFLRNWFVITFKILFRLDPDAFIIGYPGHFDVLMFAPFLKLKGKPVFFNPLVSLYDTFVNDRKVYGAGSLAASMLYTVDRKAFSFPAMTFWDTQTHSRYISETFGIPMGKFSVIPVGAEDIYFKNEQTEKSKIFRVFFFGKYIPLHGIETIIEAAAILCNQEIAFVLVGRGQEYARMRALADKNSLTNITFIDWLSPSELAGEMKKSHVVLGIFRQGGKAARVVPNKVFQAMATGTPVITGRSQAMSEWFRDGEDIIFSEPENARELAEKILYVKSNPEKAREIGIRGRATVTAFATEEKIGFLVKTKIEEVLRQRQ